MASRAKALIQSSTELIRAQSGNSKSLVCVRPRPLSRRRWRTFATNVREAKPEIVLPGGLRDCAAEGGQHASHQEFICAKAHQSNPAGLLSRGGGELASSKQFAKGALCDEHHPARRLSKPQRVVRLTSRRGMPRRLIFDAPERRKCHGISSTCSTSPVPGMSRGSQSAASESTSASD